MQIIVGLKPLFARGYADNYRAIHPIWGVMRKVVRLINS